MHMTRGEYSFSVGPARIPGNCIRYVNYKIFFLFSLLVSIVTGKVQEHRIQVDQQHCIRSIQSHRLQMFTEQQTKQREHGLIEHLTTRGRITPVSTTQSHGS